MVTIDIDAEIKNLKTCLGKLGEHFEAIVKDIPEADIIESYVAVVTRATDRMVAHIKDLRKERDTLKAQVDQTGDTLESKDHEMWELRTRANTLEQKLQKAIAANRSVTVTPLNDGGKYLGERSDGDVEIITIPKGLDIFNPTGKPVWDEESKTMLLTYDGGQRLPFDMVKKIWDIQRPQKKGREHLKREILKELREPLMMILRNHKVEWGTVELIFRDFFKEKVTAKALSERHRRVLQRGKS